jgi:signal transduction histidine kinase
VDIIPAEKLSPYPLFVLGENKPHDGFHLRINNFCKKKFANGNACRDFYESLKRRPRGSYQCPFGFSTYKFELGLKHCIFTSFIPFPRAGGEQEASQAKNHKETKVDGASVATAAQALIDADAAVESALTQNLRKYPPAFHEIIKLNGAIKQHTELLLAAFPNNEHSITVFNSSQLMSTQFEILELLANQDLTRLPVKARSTLRHLAFKCVKIFETRAAQKGVRIEMELTDGNVMVCDKTFPIIPTVLIDNAIRYSPKNGTVVVVVTRESGKVSLQVINDSNFPIDDTQLFKKGYRDKTAAEGSGHGLFLAQLIAKQHNSDIVCTKDGKVVVFSVSLNEVS